LSDRKGNHPVKTCITSTKVLFRKKWMKVTKKEPAIPVSPGKRSAKRKEQEEEQESRSQRDSDMN